MAFTFTWQAVGAAITLVLIAIITRYLVSTQRAKQYPPGPPTLLGLGNLHQIPLEKPYVKFHEWATTYGEIISLKAGPANLIILQSPEAVYELFSKRSAIYSGRPFSYIAVEHVFCEHRDKHILNVQNTPYLRRWRTAASLLLGKNSLKNILPMQEATSATLSRDLLDATPSEALSLLKKWALATPLLAVCGQRLEKRDPDFADRFFRIQKIWLQLLEPGKVPPVDTFTFLRLVPEKFAPWKRDARVVRNFIVEQYFSYLETALESNSSLEKENKTGSQQPKFQSVLTKIMENEAEAAQKGDKVKFTRDELAYVGGGLIDAAVDTTWATLSSFILYIARHPEAQDKAYEEIRRASPDHVPGGDIVDNLPYTQACILEILRLCPAAPGGIPREVSRDDTYGGYHIPKGATVIANFWGIQRNTDDYDRPNDFVPERYLKHPMGLKEGAKENPSKRATYTFGAGRRICPGDQFAQNSVLVAVVKLLWAYRIVPAEPLDIDLKTGYESGLVLGPKPFKVNFILRDAAKKQVVLQDYDIVNRRLVALVYNMMPREVLRDSWGDYDRGAIL